MPDAIVAVGVDERTVDRLIDAIHGTPLEPRKWLVFGRNMRLLGLIEGHWRDITDISVGHIPHLGAGIRDGVQMIADHEGLNPSTCVWLDGGTAADGMPSDYALTIYTPGLSVEALADALKGFRAPA
jgi:hypothetical protein